MFTYNTVKYQLNWTSLILYILFWGPRNVLLLHLWFVGWSVVGWSNLIWWVTKRFCLRPCFSIDLLLIRAILCGEWLNVVPLLPWLVCWPVVRWSHLIWWVTERSASSRLIGLLTCGQVELSYMVSEWTLCSFTINCSFNLWSVGVMLYDE